MFIAGASTKLLFFVCLLLFCCCCYGNLKVSIDLDSFEGLREDWLYVPTVCSSLNKDVIIIIITYNGKKWKVALIAVSLQVFSQMFVEWSSTKHTNFVLIHHFDLLPW